MGLRATVGFFFDLGFCGVGSRLSGGLTSFFFGFCGVASTVLGGGGLTARFFRAVNLGLCGTVSFFFDFAFGVGSKFEVEGLAGVERGGAMSLARGVGSGVG